MRYRAITILLLVFSVIGTGCSKKFRLRDSDELTSAWIFDRGDAQSTGHMESQFAGNLNLKWQRKISDNPVGPLTIGAGKLIVCSSRGRAYFFDTKSGQYRGRYKSKSNLQTGIIMVDSLGYMGLGPLKDQFRCVNFNNRKTIWNAPLKDVTGSPIIIEDKVFLVSASGSVECRNRLSGDLIWQESVNAKSLAGPSYADDQVYVPLDDGRFYGFDAETGNMKYELILNEPLVSKAAVGDMIFIAGSEGTLYALDKSTNNVVWQRSFEWPMWGAPAVDRNMVFVGDNGGYLRALDKDDGHTIWEFRSNGVIVASPIIVGNFLVFASLDRNVYCVDKKTGLLNSKSQTKHGIHFSPISDGESIFIATHGGTIQCLGD
jgi:outer membrane protein assembly factor BamB